MTLIVDQVKDNISEATEFRTEIAQYDNFLQYTPKYYNWNDIMNIVIVVPTAKVQSFNSSRSIYFFYQIPLFNFQLNCFSIKLKI